MTNKLNCFVTFLVAFFIFISISSCKNEGCIDPTANNYDSKAKNDDGSCTYDREAFISTYNTSKTCNSGTGEFEMNITPASAATNTVSISNFGDYGQTINATVSGKGINIPQQTIDVPGLSILVGGIGTLDGNTLIINYTASSGSAFDNCVITATKK